MVIAINRPMIESGLLESASIEKMSEEDRLIENVMSTVRENISNITENRIVHVIIRCIDVGFDLIKKSLKEVLPEKVLSKIIFIGAELFLKFVKTIVILFAAAIGNKVYWRSISEICLVTWEKTKENGWLSATFAVGKKIAASLGHTMLICVEMALDQNRLELSEDEKKQIEQAVLQSLEKTLSVEISKQDAIEAPKQTE